MLIKRIRRSTPTPAIHVVGPSIAYIELTHGLYALVNRDDADAIAVFNWYAHYTRAGFYAVRKIRHENGRQIDVLMHRELCPSAEQVDHANMNTLDNRKCNIRPATRSENARNRKVVSKHGFKGAFKNGKKWCATIRVDGKAVYLGTFNTPEEANAAYFQAASSVAGKFARS